MKTPAAILWSTTLACLLAGAPAFAQPSGLRLTEGNRGFSLHDGDNGLRLRFSTPPPLAANQPTPAPDPSMLTRSTLRADWPVFGYGLHTSLGLSWWNTSTQVNFSTKTADLAPTTFLGFGWRSAPARNSRWSLSAEVGSRLTGSSTCLGAEQTCPAARPLGMSGDAGGNGLRLAPYVSFGATYSFDR